jgi:thiol:disulfide interchange protein
MIIITVLTVFIVNCDQQKKHKTNNGKIEWLYDLSVAEKLAQAQNKIIMIEFMAEWCPSCYMMEDSTFSNPDIINKTGAFIPLRIDVDKQKELSDQFGGNAKKYGGVGIPNILFITYDGVKIKHIIGYHDSMTFSAVMDSVLSVRGK